MKQPKDRQQVYRMAPPTLRYVFHVSCITLHPRPTPRLPLLRPPPPLDSTTRSTPPPLDRAGPPLDPGFPRWERQPLGLGQKLIQGSHFSGLTKFPDFSPTFPVFLAIFPVFSNVLFFLTENLIHFTKKCTVHLNITKNIK